MTINNNNKDINKIKLSEEVEDDYDYLDNLMSGLMTETTQMVADIPKTQENNNDKTIDIDNRNEIESEPVNPGLQKRRTPLLAQFFQDDSDESLQHDSNEGEKVDKDSEVTNESQPKKTEESTNETSIPLENGMLKKNIVDVITPKLKEDVAPPIEFPINNKLSVDENAKDNKHTFSSKWSKSFTEEEEEHLEEEEEEEDSFNAMFKELIDEKEENGIDDEEEVDLDSDVKTPLEKSGMDEIIVTRDGRSLAEVIPGLRGGQRKSEDVLADIKEKKRVVQVGNKKFSDNRYLKHVEIHEERMDEREKRIQLSQRFLQKHARFTEQEKLILNNLGLSSDEFAKIIKSQELTLKDKEEIIGLGRYGPEKHFKGKRYRTTLGDLAMLEFLVKFKFANTRILRWLSHESQNTTWQKIKRLENSGLVESQSIIGVPDLWGSTLTGINLAGYSLKPGLNPMPKMQTISATMGVNYLAACLWFNTINVLDLEDFPGENRLMGLENGEFKKVRGEDLVSELEIRSSLGKEINPFSSTVQILGDERLYDVISSNVRESFDVWVNGGKQGLSPEFIPGNEFMWVLYPMSQLTLSYHVPDLVVRRERGPNGEPRSIAVELERHTKTNPRYDKIMLSYKLDEHLYEKVIWVTPNARTARALDQAAQSVGFKNYSIIPIITETGIYNKSDIWLI